MTSKSIHSKSRFFGFSVASSFVLALSLAISACGGGLESGKRAEIPRASMPEGEAWTGVYFHPVYGYLHLVEEGPHVMGRWRRADGSAWGEISGTRAGAVFRFSWTEHKIGLVGLSADSKGKGYFVYKVDEKGLGTLQGEYGMNDDEVGAAWNCVKQQRMSPDLKSINGDTQGAATPITGGDWK